MRPTAAEVARTLASGRLKGTLEFSDGPPVTAFRHATDRFGRLLVLSRDADEPKTGLRHRTGAPHVELTVEDVPPSRGAPGLGRVILSGPMHRVLPRAIRPAVLEFARSNPVPELFDVGEGATLHLIEVSRVSLRRSGATDPVDAAEYAAAEPDPLHECERDLLDDLADHHAEQLDSAVRRLLGPAGRRAPAPAAKAVRLDRYGLLVDLGSAERGPKSGRWARLEFARGVRYQHELAHVLHPILFHHHCACRDHDDD